MGNLWLAGLALGIFVLWALYAVLKKLGPGAGAKPNPDRRRTEAMRRLEEIRKRVQDKHGPLIDPDNLPPEVMQQRIGQDVEKDAAKAAGSLKKMIER